MDGQLPAEKYPFQSNGESYWLFHERLEKTDCYLDNGKISIDNNALECAIQVSAIGKRNFLFHGAHEGGKWAAMLYSFFGTCKVHQINPLEWLTDVLIRMPEYKKDKIEELLPQNWAAAQIS